MSEKLLTEIRDGLKDVADLLYSKFGPKRCPDCKGPMWDNAAKNAERLASGQKRIPAFKCKAKADLGCAEGCEGKYWD